jgi:hypothetical protein
VQIPSVLSAARQCMHLPSGEGAQFLRVLHAVKEGEQLRKLGLCNASDP